MSVLNFALGFPWQSHDVSTIFTQTCAFCCWRRGDCVKLQAWRVAFDHFQAFRRHVSEFALRMTLSRILACLPWIFFCQEEKGVLRPTLPPTTLLHHTPSLLPELGTLSPQSTAPCISSFPFENSIWKLLHVSEAQFPSYRFPVVEKAHFKRKWSVVCLSLGRENDGVCVNQVACHPLCFGAAQLW